MSDSTLQISRYNIYSTDPRRKQRVVFNGVTGELVRLEPRVAMALEAGKVGLLRPAERDALLGSGVLVRDPADQVELLRRRYERMQASAKNDCLNFVLWPTTACNLSCPYCYEEHLEPTRITMTDEMEDRVVKFMLRKIDATDRSRLLIKFYGGEPMLHPDRCRSIATRVQNHLGKQADRLVTTIQTNATLIDERTFAEPFPRLEWVTVTLDGPRRVHDTVRVGRQRKPTYDRILRSIKLLGERGIPVQLRVNLNDEEELHEALRDMEEGGLHEVPTLHFFEGRANESFVGYICGSDSCDVQFHLDRLEHDLHIRTVLAESSWSDRYRRFPLWERHAEVCPFARRENVYAIDGAGDLWGCFYQQGVDIFRIGRLTEDGHAELNERYEEIMGRSPFDHEKCVECALLPRCWGGCFARARMQHGAFAAPICSGEMQLEVKSRELAAGLALEDM